MTTTHETPPAGRRRSTSPFTRPAIQKYCRKCHERLTGPLSHCWMCGERAAGIRWGRLAIQAGLVAVPLGLLVTAWRIMAG